MGGHGGHLIDQKGILGTAKLFEMGRPPPIAKPGQAAGAKILEADAVAGDVVGTLQASGKLQGIGEVELTVGTETSVGIGGGAILREDKPVEIDLPIK